MRFCEKWLVGWRVIWLLGLRVTGLLSYRVSGLHGNMVIFLLGQLVITIVYGLWFRGFPAFCRKCFSHLPIIPSPEILFLVRIFNV